jgi:hypothetical protein
MKHISTIHGTFDLCAIPLKFAQQHIPQILCPPDCTHDPCQEPVVLLIVSRTSRRRRGRRGTYTRDDLVELIKQVAQHLYLRQTPRAKRLSKTAVAKHMGTTYRQFQSWLIDFGIEFDEICASAINPKK